MDIGVFRELKAQINLSNLLNREYRASIGANGFIASDPLSINNALHVGAPRPVRGTISVYF